MFKLPTSALNSSQSENADAIPYTDRTKLPFVKIHKFSDSESSFRTNWASGVHFIIISLSFLTGIEFIWGFQINYIKYDNLYLICYALLAILVGYPLLLVDMSLGQFSGFSIFKLFEICIFFKGLGVSYFIVCLFKLFTFSLHKSYILLYFYHMLPFKLTKLCKNKTCNNYLTMTEFKLPWMNCSDNVSCVSLKSYENYQIGNFSSSVQQFFNKTLFSKNCSITNSREIHRPSMDILITTFISITFTITLGLLPKDIRDKILFYGSLIGYVLIYKITLSILSLDNSFTRWNLLHIDGNALLDSNFYFDLFHHFFISFGFGLGVMTTLASFNRFNDFLTIYAKLFVAFKIYITIIINCLSRSIYGHLMSNREIDSLVLIEKYGQQIVWIYDLLILVISKVEYNYICCIFYLVLTYLYYEIVCIILVGVLHVGLKDISILSYKFESYSFFILFLCQVLTMSLTFSAKNGCFFILFDTYILTIYQYFFQLLILLILWIYTIPVLKHDVYAMTYVDMGYLIYFSIIVMAILCSYQIIMLMSYLLQYTWMIKIFALLMVILFVPILIHPIYEYYDPKTKFKYLWKPSLIWGPRTHQIWIRLNLYTKKLDKKRKYQDVILQRFRSIARDNSYA